MKQDTKKNQDRDKIKELKRIVKSLTDSFKAVKEYDIELERRIAVYEAMQCHETLSWD